MAQQPPNRFPVNDEIDVIDGATVYKSGSWWKAIVLSEGFGETEVNVYVWLKQDDGWKRKQKYSIKSRDEWEADRDLVDEFVEQLPN
mgnify:CR=1 FL=1